MKIVVDRTKCPQNHPCPSVDLCPVKALIQRGYDAPIILHHKCIQCNKCVQYCPKGALRLEE